MHSLLSLVPRSPSLFSRVLQGIQLREPLKDSQKSVKYRKQSSSTFYHYHSCQYILSNLYITMAQSHDCVYTINHFISERRFIWTITQLSHAETYQRFGLLYVPQNFQVWMSFLWLGTEKGFIGAYNNTPERNSYTFIALLITWDYKTAFSFTLLTSRKLTGSHFLLLYHSLSSPFCPNTFWNSDVSVLTFWEFTEFQLNTTWQISMAVSSRDVTRKTYPKKCNRMQCFLI